MHSFNNGKIKKTQLIPETTAVYYPYKSKNRILNDSNNRKHDYDTLKNLARKSIDISLGQAKAHPVATIYQPSASTKPYYKRVSTNFRKQSGPQRYEEEDRETRVSNKSPYVRAPGSRLEQAQGKTSALNKSTHKIKSNQLLKQNSPRYFYRQPRSSLSQHYDPSI